MGKTAETIRQEATKGERNAKRRQEKEYKRQINKSNERESEVEGTLTLGFARPRCSLTARPRKPQGQTYRCSENVMIERQNISA